MTELENKTLKLLNSWEGSCGLFWEGYESLCDELCLTRSEAVKIMKSLKKDGFVVYNTTVDSAGRPNGSGYFITSLGKEMMEDTK